MIMTMAVALAGGSELAWQVSTFESGALHGNGWESGYIADSWYGEDGRAYATTDHNVDNDWDGAAVWGAGSPLDNYLIRIGEDQVERSHTIVTFVNQDDDAFGLVSNFDQGSFYLVVLTSDGAPEPMERSEEPRIALLRVDGADAEVLTGTQVDSTSGEHTLELVADEGGLNVYLDGSSVLTYLDADPLGEGWSGFYSYDAGAGDDSDAWGAEIQVFELTDGGSGDGGDGGADTSDTGGDGGDGGDGGGSDTGDWNGGWGTEAVLSPVHPCGCSGVGGGGFALFALAAVWRRRRSQVSGG